MVKIYLHLLAINLLLCFGSWGQEHKSKPFWNLDRYTAKHLPRVYVNLGTTLYHSFSKDLWISKTRGNFPNNQIGIVIDYYKMGINIQLNNRYRIAEKTPSDYQLPKQEKDSPFQDLPFDQLTERTISIRKNYYTRYSGLHFVAQAGLSFITINSAAKFTRQEPSVYGFFGYYERPNYSYTTATTNDMGIHLKAGAHFPVTPGFGLYTNFSTTIASAPNNYFGIEMGVIAGYLRKKNKKMS